ncbi:T9SS type A sorting domain-containing protein, partial [Prevotella nigrescens]|uniref:T9SS type A sorting domain-containing protein n=1 Tax=Prevotella nigrescens TaxID=28133 RepID=UPI0002AECF16
SAQTTLSLKITARKSVKGATLYVRLRPVTRTGGMLAFMKSVTLEEGKSAEYTFAVTPDAKLKPGKYLLYAEYRPKGKAYGQEVPLAGNNTQTVYIGTKTGIEELQTARTEVGFIINGNIISFSDIQKVRLLEVYNIAGTKAFSTSKITNGISLPTQNGIYVVRIVTTDGVITKKIAVK